MRRLTIDEFVDRSKKIHDNKYDYSKAKYINVQTKVTIICPEHGEFEQLPNHHLQGHGCPECAGVKRLTTQDFIKKAKEVHGDKYDYSKVDYKGTYIKVIIICPNHGKFEQSPTGHLGGSGCPECGGTGKLTTEKFIKRARDVHGDKYDYLKVKYVNVKTKVIITCSVHGDFEQTPDKHLCGHGCPKCGSVSKLNTEDFIEKAQYVHGYRYDYSKVKYINNKTKVTIICPEHGKFMQTPDRHLSGNDCPKCARLHTSKSEEQMYALLCELFGVDDVFWHYTSDLYPFECDFYIKSRDLYIELNAYWTHGFHWYDMDSDGDIAKVGYWIDSFNKSSMYESAVRTWTVRDVEKREVARKNKLNYLTFWNTDLSDFEEWMQAGCPDGQDWERMYSWKKL